MKKTAFLKKSLLVCLCLMLIAAMLFATTACKKEDGDTTGEKVSFTLKVVDKDGNETAETIETEEKTVGAALSKKGIIAGDDTQYGLYVKTVKGITADYDKDGTYWAFYVNGEASMTGVDSTDVTDGATYMFKIEK